MILITDTNPTRRDAVAEMLYYMGILSHSLPPEDAKDELSDKYSALLFTSVADSSEEMALADLARERWGMTVAALTVGEDGSAFDVTFPPDALCAEIASGICEYRLTQGLPPLGTYTLGELDVSQDKPNLTYRGAPVTLTRTETMILRYLVRTYPTPASPADVLKYAFRPSRAPELSSVRTHVSVMNKKFRRATGHTLAESTKSGYILSSALSCEAVTV